MSIVRPALSISCGLVAAVSLSLKVWALTGMARAVPVVDRADIVMLLEQHGYQANPLPYDGSLVWVAGVSNVCTIRVAEIAPQGWHASVVRQQAAGNQLFYTFAGGIYAEQPILRTRSHYYWIKLTRYLGLSTPHRPVLSVIAAPACGQDVPLQALARLTTQ